MEQLLTKLAEQGVLAIVLAISIFANFYLFKRIMQIQDSRLNDAKEATIAVGEPLKQLKGTIDTLISMWGKK